jgi:hypothetical protein
VENRPRAYTSDEEEEEEEEEGFSNVNWVELT